MCTNEDEDFIFLENLLEALIKHIDDIKTLQFFKITIKVLAMDGKLFKHICIFVSGICLVHDCYYYFYPIVIMTDPHFKILKKILKF